MRNRADKSPHECGLGTHECVRHIVAALVLVLTGCSGRHHTVAGTPTVTQTMQRQVTQAIDLGDGDVITRDLRQRLVADPWDLATRLALADRYWKAGALELAIDHYRLAAERFPDHPKVAMLLARALRDFNHPQDAIAALRKFSGPNAEAPPDLLSLLGILEDDAGEFAEAERAYRAALTQAPARADLHNNLGYNLLLQAKPKEAIEQFQAALKIEPHSQLANNNLGLALVAQWKDDSQPTEALLHWQSVSDPASAHNNLATVLIEQGRYADARKELEIALGYQGNHAAALANLRLAGELDGGPKTPVTPVHNSFWKRVKTVFNARKPATAEQTAANLK